MAVALKIVYGPRSRLAPVADDTQQATYMFPCGHFGLIIPTTAVTKIRRPLLYQGR